MKSWLKNGYRGIIVAAILAIIILGILIIILRPELSYLLQGFHLIFSFPGVIITAVIMFKTWGYEIPDTTFWPSLIISIIISISLYFLVGVLVGKIIKKIKSRKSFPTE